MMFDFDKVFHKSHTTISKGYPCRKCTEPKYAMNNPYYRSEKCKRCNKYEEWRKNNDT